MRIAILSDIHANLEALRAVLDRIAGDEIDRIACLGDIVGYNTDPEPCIHLLQEAGALCVAGNHDRAVTGQISTDGFSSIAVRAVAWTRARLEPPALDYLKGLPLKASIGNQLVMVHGALHPEVGCETVRLDNEEGRRMSFDALAAHPSGARVCAFGHTHRMGIYELVGSRMRELPCDELSLRDDAYYLINPGTVGEPRMSDRRASYLVLDTDRRVLSVRRVRYDHATAVAKTRKAGLAPRFSRIPAPVRLRLLWGLHALGLYEPVKRLTTPRSRRIADPTRSGSRMDESPEP
jgi:predicted phosphodiesterase